MNHLTENEIIFTNMFLCQDISEDFSETKNIFSRIKLPPNEDNIKFKMAVFLEGKSPIGKERNFSVVIKTEKEHKVLRKTLFYFSFTMVSSIDMQQRFLSDELSVPYEQDGKYVVELHEVENQELEGKPLNRISFYVEREIGN